MAVGVPEGFRVLKLRRNPFVELNGPLYGRLDGETFVLGLPVEERHCNPVGMCHGGMLATLSDMLLLLGSNVQAKIGRFLVTVSLDIDFIGAVSAGSWIEGRAQVLRTGRTLVFAQGTLDVAGKIVLRTSGVLKPTGEPVEDFSPQRYFE